MSRQRDYFMRNGRYFDVREACESWRGTPFRVGSCVKGEGGGVDCARFVGAVFLEIGAIEEAIAVPPYDVNHAEHSEVSVLRAWFETPAVRRRVRRVDEAEDHLDGDIVFPRVGRTEHHVAIRVGRIVYHIVRPSGWCAPTVAQLVHAGHPLHASRYRLLEA